MPISGPSSYVPTINLFIAHWEDANAAYGSEITVPPNSTTRDMLIDFRDELTDLQSDVQGYINDVEIGNSDLAQRKEAMLSHLNDFNRRVRGLLPGSTFLNALPDVPQISIGPGRFITPLQDMDTLWRKINDSLDPGEPFLLSGGYALANFQTDLNALLTAYETDGDNEQNLKLARDERNKQQDLVVPLLVAYRRVIEALFAPGSPIVESLPALYPAPGHTPDAVTAEGTWADLTSTAVITYSASTDATLDHYQLRRSTVSPYNTADETVVATNQPEDPHEFSTTDGLATPGDTALYRVYVVLTTGNEKGSATVSVTRPA